jgi:Kdo2-lipid IVA lauroyltransferase/acyltransferase
MPTPTENKAAAAGNTRDKTRAKTYDKRDPGRWRAVLLAPWYWPTWLALGFMRALMPLPYPLLMRVGAAVGAAVRRMPIDFVRIARVNLRMCLPAFSAEQRELLLRQHFRNLGMSLMEMAMAWWYSDARVRKLTHLEGLEHLQSALAKGHGALLLSAHFTTLEMSGRALTVRMPNINVMYRPTSNAVMAFFLARNRARRLKRAIQRDDIRSLVTALKGNEPVWYASDQAYRKKGAQMVPFFGIPAATNTATSRLAKMTGAPVLPYFSERLPNFAGYRLIVQPPWDNFPSDDPIADALRYHHAIEAQIARVPEQYLWIHRRFKGLNSDYPNYYARSGAHDN